MIVQRNLQLRFDDSGVVVHGLVMVTPLLTLMLTLYNWLICRLSKTSKVFWYFSVCIIRKADMSWVTQYKILMLSSWKGPAESFLCLWEATWNGEMLDLVVFVGVFFPSFLMVLHSKFTWIDYFFHSVHGSYWVLHHVSSWIGFVFGGFQGSTHACALRDYSFPRSYMYTHTRTQSICFCYSLVTWLLIEGVIKHFIFGFGPVTWLKCGDGEFSGAC